MSDPKKFILTKLKETGYPLEIEILNIIEKNFGIHYYIQDTFFDEDEHKNRTIDVNVFLSRKVGGYSKELKENPLFLYPYLPIECKKSNKHTVFFSSSKKTAPFSGQLYSLMKDDNDLQMATEIHLNSDKLTHYKEHVSYNYTMIDTKTDDFFEATMQLIKFVNYWRHTVLGPSKAPNLIYIWFPLIIMEDNLWEAKIEEGKITDLNKINHIIYVKSYYDKFEDTRHFYSIDVIKKKFLQEYLELLKKSVNSCENYIKSNQKYLYKTYKIKKQIKR